MERERPASSADAVDWVYPLKRRIIASLFTMLALAVLLAVLVIVTFVGGRLMHESHRRTLELGASISSTMKSMMMLRSPGVLQRTLEALVSQGGSIEKAFIVNSSGRVAYSTDKRDVGKIIDRFADASCRGCHANRDSTPKDQAIVWSGVQRSVTVLENEPRCRGCHTGAGRVNGKLIIDHSIYPERKLIVDISFLVIGAGALGLLLLYPVVSRGVNRYIEQIVSQNSELSLMYLMVERLSRTIDTSELRFIVVEIIRDLMNAHSVLIVLPHKSKGYNAFEWEVGAPAKMRRREIARANVQGRLVHDWLDGGLFEQDVIEHHGCLYLSIESTERLALISIEEPVGGFPMSRIRLIKAMCEHIAVAFENARLYSMAISDELTGLYAIRHFRHCLELKQENYERFGEKYALLMIDLDNFKRINDTHGHVAGDEVLKGAARAIQGAVREQDSCFRYGGEEFAVILGNAGLDTGRVVARRILDDIKGSVVEFEGVSISVTASIGISACPENAESPRELILSADAALYEAKKAGKNRFEASWSRL